MDYYRSNRAYCRERNQAQCPDRRALQQQINMSPDCRMRECHSIACPALAMAYVPVQQFNQMFDLTKGLQMGTIFPELCLPFCGKRGVCK